jgi:hypothetical protein
MLHYLQRERLVRLDVVCRQDSESSGDIDRLAFPFVDLYVPALSPRIHCSEAALQFAENTTFVFLPPTERDEF